MPNLNPRLGVSTWSLNQSLSAGTPLLDIPAQVAAHGLGKLEVCHFHFPSTDPEYLAEFRAALDASDIEFYTLLIDEGDLTHPEEEHREKVLNFMTHWAQVASECGAKRVRAIAGYAAPSEDTLQLSAYRLEPLWHRANHMGGTLEEEEGLALEPPRPPAQYSGVRVVTENWHRLLDHPQDVRRLLEIMRQRLAVHHGEIGLKLDFGNWPGPRKYTDLPKIAGLAECTHAKAYFPAPGQMDRDDFTRCLDICADANFTGPHILIFSDPGDEWESLDQMRDVALPYVSN